MCIFKNQEKIKQDNIFSVMTKSLDTSRLFGQSSFIFLKNIFLIFATFLFGIGHIGIHLNHKKEIKKKIIGEKNDE